MAERFLTRVPDDTFDVEAYLKAVMPPDLRDAT
jgi:hypothetical protein